MSTSIDKFSSISWSGINKVSGAPKTLMHTISNADAHSYLLREVGAGPEFAYSLRKLDPEATTAITVENSSGSLADIGFNAYGDLDTAALTAHCGSNYGRVSKWWDQSGNGNHVEQSAENAGFRPYIVDTSGNIITTTANSIPALDFYYSSTNRWLEGTFVTNNGDEWILTYTGEFRTVTSGQYVVSQWTSSTSTQCFQASIMGAAQKLRMAGRYNDTSKSLGRADTTNTVSANTEYIVVGYMSASPYTGDIDVNGDTATTLTGFPSSGSLNNGNILMAVGRRSDTGTANYQGYLAEVVMWSTNMPDRDDVMEKTNTYYSIF